MKYVKYVNRNVSSLDYMDIGHVVKETKNQIVVFGKRNKRYDIPVWKIKIVNNDILIDMNLQEIEDSYTIDKDAPLPTSSNESSISWQSITNPNLYQYEGKYYYNSLVNKMVKTRNDHYIGYVFKETDEQIIIIDNKENVKYEIAKSKIVDVGINIIIDIDTTSIMIYKIDHNTSYYNENFVIR